MFRAKTFFFLVFHAIVFSQKTDSLYIYNQNSKINNFDGQGKFLEADSIADELLSYLNQKEVSPKYFAIVYQSKAKILKSRGFYNESMGIARKSLNIALKIKDSFNIADSYNTIGMCHYFLSDYDSTKLYYEKSFNIKKAIKTDYYNLAVSAYNLAIVYEDTGFFDKAMELYKDAEKSLLSSENKKNFLSDVYVGIAHIFKYKKDIEQEEKYADRAMDVGLKKYGEFNHNMTFVYTSYANILESKNKYKESIELLKKSLKIRETNYGKQHRWTCESYVDLGQAYILDKQYDMAELYFRKAIEISTKINSKIYLSAAKASLAFMYCERKINNKEVETLLKESIAIDTDIFGANNDIVTKSYYFLAKNAENRKDEQSFFYYINKALTVANYDLSNLIQTNAPFQVLDILVLESDWYEQKYKQNGWSFWLLRKFYLLELQVELIQFLEKKYGSEISKISIANNYRNVFENGLKTCWNLYIISKNKKYLEKAFELTENSRNTILLDGLQDNKYKSYSNLPQDLILFEKKIQKKLARIKMDLYYEKKSNSPDKEKLSNLIDQRITIGARLDSLRKAFTENYPKYKEFKSEKKTIKISDVQKIINNDTQLITYFLGNNNLYTFNITKYNVSFHKKNIKDTLVNKIKILKKQILERQNSDEICKELYSYLLGEQIDINKKSLIVIPDNVLNYIPFEILKNENNESLIQNFTISYSGSLSLYIELTKGFFNNNLPNYWLGFSPIYKLTNVLPSTVNEVKEISKLVKGKVFLEDESTKINFFKNSNKYSILHLAMHAEIDNENPMYNKLLFSDGELTSSEIYISDIKANLVVLSACNTGFGKLEKGEGVISMARAFNYSGVPSVIMSLWKVPDKEAKTIMVSFYEHLKMGETKNEALKNAKLDYLNNTKDENLKHPYYWSGFVLNGNIKSLAPPSDKENHYLLGGVLLIGLLVFGVRWNNKKKSIYSK